MAADVFTLRWGILATGGIAATFTRDLLLDPASTRGTSDIKHVLAAVASSNSTARAAAFVQDECKCAYAADVHTHGCYADLAADRDVDIIYIATPHSHHFQHAMLCLRAGKHVLCEKPLTVNARQARRLVEEAAARGLFLLEAVWTRFFPMAGTLRALVAEGSVIGDVKRVFADNAFSLPMLERGGAEVDVKHRMVNMDLAGGALLDSGIYGLTWLFQFLYHVQEPDKRERPAIVSSMTKFAATGADETTSVLLTFPSTGAQGIATTSMRVGPQASDATSPTVRIQGTLGEIHVYGPAYRPDGYRIIVPNTTTININTTNNTNTSKPSTSNPPPPPPPPHLSLPSTPSTSPPSQVIRTNTFIPNTIPGTGMFFEADECARCIRDGRRQSGVLPWRESVLLLEVMDEVRRQHGLVYPEAVEGVEGD